MNTNCRLNYAKYIYFSNKLNLLESLRHLHSELILFICQFKRTADTPKYINYIYIRYNNILKHTHFNTIAILLLNLNIRQILSFQSLTS